jgi:hypothetical protein
MATLTGQSIASSYEQLLHVDTDGGGNTTTLVPIKDGDNGTTFAAQLSTTTICIDNPTTSSSSQGGILRLQSDDGAALGDTHRLGVIEFGAAEDGSNTITTGARIEAIADAAWSASENGADMVFYTTDGNASQSEVMRLTADNLVGIGTDSPSSELEVYKDDDGVAIGPVLSVTRHSDSPAAADIIGSIDFKGRGNDSALHSYARINSVIQYANNPNEGGELHFAVLQNDTIAPSMMINTDGKVGIGTVSPAGQLSLYKSGSAPEMIWEVAGNAAARNWGWRASGSAWGDFQLRQGSSLGGALDTSVITILDGGDVTFTGDLIMADGKGIDFSADASPASGMTAEILDDYEEGTWGAVVTDASSNAMTMNGSFDTGYYTKVGNLVTVSGIFVTTALGTASGGIRITGLPFASVNNNAAYSGGGAGYGSGLAITVGHTVACTVQIDNAYIDLRVWDVATGTSVMLASEWTDNGGIMLNFSYRAA